MECQELNGFIDAYVDGEFDTRECGEIEAHLRTCRTCHDLTGARIHLKQLVRATAERPAPPALRGRILSCIEDLDRHAPAEPTVEDALLFGAPAPPVPSRSMAWSRVRRSAPLVASVGFLSMFVWMTSGGFAGQEVLDDTVQKHVRALPLEVNGRDLGHLEGWARDKVDFNPRLPVFRAGMVPVGARLSHVLDHPAVYLAYASPDGQRRASLFVFADAELDLRGQSDLARRLGDREVHLASRRGYNVVLWKDAEIVYSLVSDLDEDTLLSLIEAAPAVRMGR